MENITTFDQSATFNFRPKIWLLDTVMNGVLVIVALYLLLALIFHQVKVEKSRNETFLHMSLEKKYGVLSKYTCILIGITSLVYQGVSLGRNAMDLHIMNGIQPSARETFFVRICAVIPHVAVFSVSIGTGLVYLYLWFRQRIFYVHPSLKILTNKYLSCFSFGILMFWLFSTLALLPAFLILVRYHFVNYVGCTIDDVSYRKRLIISLAWVALSISEQISLLFLFVYPILKRTFWKDRLQSPQNTSLLRRVKKAVVLASICLASDILAVLLENFFDEPHATTPKFDFGINLLVNHLATVACFDYWKQLLWPWTYASNNRDQSCSSKNEETSNSTQNNARTTLRSP